MSEMRFVEYKSGDGIAVIRLNRPERGNALGDELVADLVTADRMLREDREARVGVLTGTGKFFCTGMDLKQWAETGNPFIHDDFKRVLNPATLAKPVIAAINGWAVAAGMVLALERCELIVMADDAKMGLFEIRHGTPIKAEYRITLSLPPAIAAEIMFGYEITAQRALQMGLVNRVVPADAVMETAMEMARHLLTLPPRAVTVGKRYLHAAAHEIPRELSEFRERVVEPLFHAQDSLESVRAFVEKRAPDYKGD